MGTPSDLAGISRWPVFFRSLIVQLMIELGEPSRC